MSFLLDTPVFSEYTKKQPSEKVLEWIEDQAEESLYLSVLTIGELEKGIKRLATGKRQTALMEWLEDLIYRFDTRILPLDLRVLRQWADLTAEAERIGRVLPVMDSLIAATTLAHNLIIVTRNVTDFEGTRASLLNIWE